MSHGTFDFLVGSHVNMKKYTSFENIGHRCIVNRFKKKLLWGNKPFEIQQS
jgi:hypothetical protein